MWSAPETELYGIQAIPIVSYACGFYQKENDWDSQNHIIEFFLELNLSWQICLIFLPNLPNCQILSKLKIP